MSEENNSSPEIRGKIPEDLKDFYRKHYPIMVGKSNIPKEFSSQGEGFKSERYLFEEDLKKLSKETLIYIALSKKPDFVIKNFKSGGIGTY